MSANNSVGNFNLNTVNLRKPIKFPDGTTQNTAYTGSSGIPTLSNVLSSGNNAGGLGITNVGDISMAAGNEILQNPASTLILSSGNELNHTNIVTAQGASAGAAAGVYLPVTINGVAYKIALLNT